MPPTLPYPRAVVYASGVLELLGAIAICVPPANIYMWLNPQLFPTIGAALPGWRLVLQVALLACIWWSTQPARSDTQY